MSLVVWAILVVLVLGAAFTAVFLADRSRSTRLKFRFGPEYDRTLRETGNRRATERRLAGIARRRDSLDITPLAAPRRAALRAEWSTTQILFVDDPATATTRADELVSTALRERGYPTDRRDETADLLAVDNPSLAARLRASQSGPAAAGGNRGARPPAPTPDAKTATVPATATTPATAPGAAATTGTPTARDTDTLRRRFLELRAVFDALVTPAGGTSAVPSGGGDRSGPTERQSPTPGSARPSRDEPGAREAAISGRRQRP